MSEASMTEDKRSMQQFAGVAGNRHYNDLDGFRAIAAIAIVVMHVHVRGEYVHTSTWLSTAVEPLVRSSRSSSSSAASACVADTTTV